MTAFFAPPRPVALNEAAALAGVPLPEGADPHLALEGVAPLDRAGPREATFLDNPAYAERAGECRAGACYVSPRFAARLAPGVVALVTSDPYRAFAALAARLYPAAMRPGSAFGTSGVASGALVHPTARLEAGAVVDPGAVVGPGAEVGAGSLVAAGAVLGPGVRVGRDASIGPGVTAQHALIGNRVILHPGVRVGQDGFGFAMGPRGHLKVPQVGRVVIQDDVEIGANSCVDRGMNRDTVIGEGTKIDNLVQVGHNVVIGRHCVIVSGVGISGSAVLEDFVVLGGQVGVVGHVTIGAGAQVAGSSNVNADVPPGARYGGTPAKPVREWFREITALKALGRERRGGARGGGE